MRLGARPDPDRLTAGGTDRHEVDRHGLRRRGRGLAQRPPRAPAAEAPASSWSRVSSAGASDSLKLAARQPKLSPKRGQLGVQRVDRLTLADRIAVVDRTAIGHRRRPRPGARRGSAPARTSARRSASAARTGAAAGRRSRRPGRDRPRRPRSSRSARPRASSSTPWRAITLVLPGLEPIPSNRQQARLLELVAQPQLAPRRPVQPAEVEVVAAGGQARLHRLEVDAVRGRVDEHVAPSQPRRRASSTARASTSSARALPPPCSDAAAAARSPSTSSSNSPATSSDCARSWMIAGAIVPAAPRTATCSWFPVRGHSRCTITASRLY